MNTGDSIGEGLRVCGSLNESLSGVGSSSPRYLVSAVGSRRRRPRWVLRWWPDASEIDASLRARLLRLATLDHAALALPCDFGLDNATGRTYSLRTYIDGAPLLSALEGKSPREILPWLVATTEALETLHRFRLEHGRVSAENVIVPRSSLFGRRVAGTPLAVLTDPLVEMAEAKTRFDAAPDLSALGELFYRILTRHEIELEPTGFPVAPAKLNPAIPVDLERVLLKLLHPEAAKRYRDASELSEDLRRIPGAESCPELPPAGCFVHRERELARATECLREPSRAFAIAITGEAGIGKSAFVDRLVLEAKTRGYLTVGVRCYRESETALAPLRALAARLATAEHRRSTLGARIDRLLEESDFQPEPGARRAVLRGLVDYFTSCVRRRPTLIVVDEVHFADPLTVEFLVEVTREISLQERRAARGDSSPRLSLAMTYRSESSFRPALAPLLDRIAASDAELIAIELDALSDDAVTEWVERTSRDPRVRRAATSLSAPFRGNPFAIRQVLCGAPPVALAEPDDDGRRLHGWWVAQLSDSEQRFVQFLAVLGRPAPVELLSELTGEGMTATKRHVATLASVDLVSHEDDLVFFRHGSMEEGIRSSLSSGDMASMHERIALALANRADESGAELAHHWLRSTTPERGFEVGLEAARDLARNHEDGRALDFYRRVAELVPDDRRDLRRGVLRETADLLAKTGDYAGGIEILESMLGELSTAELAHVRGRIGFYHHLAGQIAEAVVHFEAARALLHGEGESSSDRDRFMIESELATIALHRGEYERVARICRHAIEALSSRASTTEDRALTRATMSLHATLGCVALRRFSYGDARKFFEQSLESGAELAAVPEKSLVYNNLGVLHVQQDRYRDAIAAFRRAAEIARQLGQDLMLVSVEGNLAVLHAKIGDGKAAEAALERTALCAARSGSRRARFLHLHSAGLVALVSGHYATAISSFKEAIIVGGELGDRHMVAFDLVYLGECQLYRGEATAAAASFARAIEEPGVDAPPPVAAMVRARQTLLSAFRGERRRTSAGEDDRTQRSGDAGARVEYLDAWNALYIGWANRLLGRWREARKHLDSARVFFTRAAVPSAVLHAELELALLDADRQQHGRASRRLERLETRFAKNATPLDHPALAARLRAYQTRVELERDPPDLDRATSLLVEAESHLIGRRVQDLEHLVSTLRRRLNLLRLERGGVDRIVPPPRSETTIVRAVRELARDTDSLLRRLQDENGLESGIEVVRELRGHADHLREVLRRQEQRVDDRERSASDLPGVDAIVGSSPAVTTLKNLVRRVAAADLPVLITGETGTGKDLVARALHEESSRRSEVFLSINCAALPEGLLEAELFGHLRGAYTGAEEDRSGLLIDADGGTFFFDEIGEMSLDLQGKLLKILDRGCVRPIGGTEEVSIDLRYVFSTHRRLSDLVEDGRMREDFYYRVRAVEIPVPPLRERIEDLDALIEHFRKLASDAHSAVAMTTDARAALRAYPWPGNVRELRNVITRLALTGRETIDEEDVRKLIGVETGSGVFSSALLRSRSLDDLQVQLEREYLLQLHADKAGDMKAVAAQLGITLRGLYKRLQRLGVDPRRLR